MIAEINLKKDGSVIFTNFIYIYIQVSFDEFKAMIIKSKK